MRSSHKIKGSERSNIICGVGRKVVCNLILKMIIKFTRVEPVVFQD